MIEHSHLGENQRVAVITGTARCFPARRGVYQRVAVFISASRCFISASHLEPPGSLHMAPLQLADFCLYSH